MPRHYVRYPNHISKATSSARAILRIRTIITNLAIRLFMVAVGLLLPLGALEIGVRLVNLAPPAQPNPTIWEPHPLFGWWHIAYSGGTFHSDYNEFEAEVRINARSLRDREIGYDNPDQALRILSLADSFGEALQVDLDETYHKQLERLLIDAFERPVEVVNAGVGGWGTDQEAIFYLAEGFRYQPDIVMLSFFIRNDAVNNYGPLEIERNGGRQQKQFFSLSPQGALIPPDLTLEDDAEPGPDKIKPEEKVNFEPQAQLPLISGNTPPFLGLADTLWRMSGLYRLIVPYLRDIPLVVQQIGSSGILGGEAVIRASHPTVPIPFFVYQDPLDDRFEAAWKLTESIIARLRDEVEQRGSRFIVIIIGAPEQINPAAWEQTLSQYPAMQGHSWKLTSPNRRLVTFLAKENIPHLDLLPIFQQAAAQVETPPLHFRHDQHWTPAGHRIAAQAIYEFMSRELIEPSIP